MNIITREEAANLVKVHEKEDLTKQQNTVEFLKPKISEMIKDYASKGYSVITLRKFKPFDKIEIKSNEKDEYEYSLSHYLNNDSVTNLLSFFKCIGYEISNYEDCFSIKW
jgi:hypothetical protein